MKLTALVFAPLILGSATGATIQLTAPADANVPEQATTACHDAGCRHHTTFSCQQGFCPPGSSFDLATFCRDAPFELPGCR